MKNTKHKRAEIRRPFLEKQIVRRLRSRMLSMMLCNVLVEEVVEDVVAGVGLGVGLLRVAVDASDTDTRDISSSALIILTILLLSYR